jgi:predicted dehydrogenase
VKKHRIGVIMNGVTGRMGQNQHLIRSILAIRKEGGVRIDEDTAIWPDPILVGRDGNRVRQLASAHGIEHWSTDLDACLGDPAYEVYFDAQRTTERPAALHAAIAAGKHIYCEKPIALDLATALGLARAARNAGVKHGVVADKLFLPGFLKLRRLIDEGFLGRIIAARGEFGYWVFEGDQEPSQRPSWNYRAEEGGGIVFDMFCHWRYLLDHVLAPVRSVSCVAVTHIPTRFDEHGRSYDATAEDAAYATFGLEGGITVQLNSSWATRVYRDDLFTLQVDGTAGSAVAGLFDCHVQDRANTPRALWNPDLRNTADFRASWRQVPDSGPYDNGFKVQWELFLRHLVLDEPFAWNLLEGAKCVQLAELAHRSWRERCWIDVTELEA